MTKICMAGVTGWTGKAIAAGILDAADLALTGALARKAAGIDVGDVLGREPVGVTITADLGAALDGAEVLIDYTHPDAVKAPAAAAITRGITVVIGTERQRAEQGKGVADSVATGGRLIIKNTNNP